MGKLSLEDRVAVISGAGQGIGLGIARAFGREGARIIIGELVADRGEAAASVLASEGHRVQAIPLDVTVPDSCTSLVERVLAEHGRIDILVNCAGLFILHKSEEMPESAWRLQVDVMLNGVFFLTQAVARQAMIPQQAGTVVTIGWRPDDTLVLIA